MLNPHFHSKPVTSYTSTYFHSYSVQVCNVAKGHELHQVGNMLRVMNGSLTHWMKKKFFVSPSCYFRWKGIFDSWHRIVCISCLFPVHFVLLLNTVLWVGVSKIFWVIPANRITFWSYWSDYVMLWSKILTLCCQVVKSRAYRALNSRTTSAYES